MDIVLEDGNSRRLLASSSCVEGGRLMMLSDERGDSAGYALAGVGWISSRDEQEKGIYLRLHLLLLLF